MHAMFNGQDQEPVGLRKNRLQKCLGGPYSTAFLAYSPTVGGCKTVKIWARSAVFRFRSPKSERLLDIHDTLGNPAVSLNLPDR